MKKIHLFLLLGFLGFVGSAWVGYVSAGTPTGDDEVQSSDLQVVLTGSNYGLRLSSGGHLLPGALDGVSDLGSPNLSYRNLYFTGENISTGTVVTSSAGISIPVNTGYVSLLSTAGALAMTAAPNISTATARDGDVLFVVNGGTNAITLRDRLSIVNTGLALGSASRALSYLDNISFVFVASTGAWVEKFFTNVQ